jgi:hypothetical protein
VSDEKHFHVRMWRAIWKLDCRTVALLTRNGVRRADDLMRCGHKYFDGKRVGGAINRSIVVWRLLC